MKNHLLTFVVFAFAIANPATRAQRSSGAPVYVVVTVEARKCEETPVINREDLMVREGRDRDEVIDWVPVQGEHASLSIARRCPAPPLVRSILSSNGLVAAHLA